MRRILITPEMEKDAETYSKNMFAGKRTSGENGFVTPEYRLDYLKSKSNITKKIYLDYIDNLKRLKVEVNSITPDKYDSYKTLYFNLSDTELKKPISVQFYNKANGTTTNTKAFYDWIIWAMRYKDVKDDTNLKEHFKKCGLKTCVYCNSQFAVAVDKSKGKSNAHYELDHIWPKSKYPFLCTNFFNLVPCCGTCNRRKSDLFDKGGSTGFKQEKLNLYTKDSSNIEIFKFHIDEPNLLRYWLSDTHNPDDINVKFSAIDSKNNDLEQFYDDKFDIKALCKTHTDVIEELLWKKRIYNQSYITFLEEQFGLLFPNMTDFNRFLLGNYDAPEDVHKRPLAKMIQDIARQLDMI